MLSNSIQHHREGVPDDADLATDAGLRHLNQERLSQETFSGSINEEARDTTSDDTVFDGELPVELTADDGADEVSLSWEDEVDGAIGPVSHDIEDGFYREELSFNLSDNGLVEVTSICPFGPETSDAAVDDVMGSVPNDAEDSAVEEELPPGLLTNFHIIEIGSCCSTL